MSQQTADSKSSPPPSFPALAALASLLPAREHVLAGKGDAGLAASALAATKSIFDLGVSLEAESHPHLHPFLASIMNPPPIVTRSSAGKVQEAAPEPEELLPYTPLGDLTTEDMDAEQVWAQLELRAGGICAVVREVGEGEQPPDEEEGEEGSEGDEEMTAEEWERMMDEEEYEEGESDEESEGSEGSEEGIVWNDLGEEMSEGDEEGEEDEEDEDDGDEEDEDEDEEDEEEEDEDLEGDVEMGSGSDAGSASPDDGYAPGPSKPRKLHPTLDDTFFSIDEFNRLTEEQEAGRVTSGALGGDEDEEAELDDIGQMFLEEGDDDAEIMYSDFFEPPPRPATDPKDKEDAKGKKKRSKKSKVMFADEEDEEPEPEDETRDVMERVKGDLFDDSEDEDGGEEALSTHERRQRELARQIAELESEAIGPKDWTLLGEASSRSRPQNSLLEEDLEFEHTAKVVPTITEESVVTLEELIKRRILDGHFDDPVRVRAYEPTAFLPSRFFELQDTQSTKSLAQIYEDEYTAQASGGKAVDARDAKLAKEHDEIERLWGEICYKLDALSSLHFVPKAPKAAITTIDNIATTSMETALPATQSAASMLAPHEVFAGPSKGELVARSEQTPEEAKRARAAARRAKKSQRTQIAAAEKLYGKKRKSVREEKEEALAGLVKSGKGVTVLGKGAKEDAKRKKRDAVAAAGGQDAKRLKL